MSNNLVFNCTPYLKKDYDGMTMKLYPNLWYELSHCKLGLGTVAKKAGMTPAKLKAFARNVYCLDFSAEKHPNVWSVMQIEKSLGGFSADYLYSDYLWDAKPISEKKKKRKQRKAHQKISLYEK